MVTRMPVLLLFFSLTGSYNHSFLFFIGQSSGNLTLCHNSSGGPQARFEKEGGWRGHLALRQGTPSPAPLIYEWITAQFTEMIQYNAEDKKASAVGKMQETDKKEGFL
jgi:hypothetical protein